MLRTILIVGCLLHHGLAQRGSGVEEPTHGKCEPLIIDLCKDIGYNSTIMPNLLDHDNQIDAGLEINQYFPLIKSGCSSQLKLFLCSLYIPVCTILSKPLPPCRSVCEASRNACEVLLNRYGFVWPKGMICDKFPERPALCVGPNEQDGPTTPGNPFAHIPSIDGSAYTATSPINYGANPVDTNTCPSRWTAKKYELVIDSETIITNCGLPCHDVLFTAEEEKFARYWIGIWSMLCFVSTLFTVLTFLIDMRRFKYPERPIIFISGCYFVVSLCYMVGFILKDKISCIKSDGGMEVVTQGTKNEGCTILFMLTYFFTMAASVWWVILTLTWVLAAGLKWGHEAIESNSQYFHLAAWAIPAIMTITIIATGSIDGDVLSGICFTGLSTKTALIGYIIGPLAVYLLLGTIFLVTGFISLFKIRTVMKHGGTKTNKLEKLMVRIGIFSVLYTVPAIMVIACNVYELINREKWMKRFRSKACTNTLYRGSITCPVSSNMQTDIIEAYVPNFTWFIFKYLGFLIVGITSGFWIWSNKTVSSWGNFFRRLCCLSRGSPSEAAV